MAAPTRRETCALPPRLPAIPSYVQFHGRFSQLNASAGGGCRPFALGADARFAGTPVLSTRICLARCCSRRSQQLAAHRDRNFWFCGFFIFITRSISS